MKAFARFIETEQQPISEALLRVIETLPHAVQEIARYALLSGGKRLRPILTVLCGRLFKEDITETFSDFYDAAIVLEMFHVASLLHDDVLDNADSRRGQVSVHIKYGIRPCLLAGDALLAAGNRLMAQIAIKHNKPELMESISSALLHTSSGEIEEISLVGKILPNLEAYYDVIEGKTAWIIRAACEIGAILAGASLEDRKHMADFGHNLGMAFQIVDDALDFAPESETGKPSGGDLRERKCTPPIFMYAKDLTGQEKDDFIRKFATAPTPVFESQAIGEQGSDDFSEDELKVITQAIIDKQYPQNTKQIANLYLGTAKLAMLSYNNDYSALLLQALGYVATRKK